MNFTGTPFSFSRLNKFFYVGCDNFATMADIATVFGCTSESDCTPNMKVESLWISMLGF